MVSCLRTEWRFEMDTGVALLLTVIMIVIAIAIITTGIHIVKPGEIGFLYRGRKCLRHFGPAFVFCIRR